MKKLALVFALAVAMMATVSASATDIVFDVSFDNGATWQNIVPTCAGTTCNFAVTNVNGSGLDLSGSVGLLTTANVSNTSVSTTNLTNNNATSLSFWLREVTSGFVNPASNPLNLVTSESATVNVGTFQGMVTTGFLNPGTASECSATTGSINSDASGSSASAVCTSLISPFTLETLAKYTLDGSSSIGTTAKVTVSAVPEPTSMMLFGSGLLGFAGVIRRKLGK